jgi:hypothetical protein
MTTQDAMSLLYPVLTTAVFLNAVLLFLYWLMIRRTRQVLAHVSFFVTEFVVLLLLTLLTGSDPIFDIEKFRYWVVLARFAMLVALLWGSLECVRTIFVHSVDRSDV